MICQPAKKKRRYSRRRCSSFRFDYRRSADNKSRNYLLTSTPSSSTIESSSSSPRSNRTGSLEYTPAIETGTPARDPVLEVATEDPAVRHELNLRLDALVDALDRSTGSDEAFYTGVWEELVSGLTPF